MDAPSEDPAEIRAALERGAIARVLILRAARVGDTLHVRPALALLRRALPTAHLVFVCSEYAAAAARGAEVDHVVPWRHKGRSPGALLARRRSLAELRRLGPFDLLLGLEDKPWGRRLARSLGIRYWHASSTAGEHVVERKAGVLTPLALWNPQLDIPPPIRWSPGEAALRRAQALLAELPRPWIGLQAGSHAGRSRFAPRRRRDPAPEWLAAVGRLALEASGGSVVLHAGLGGSEGRAARRLVEAIGSQGGRRALLLQDLGLEEIGATLGLLDGLVSANTGPAHLAAAQAVPLVLLEGPSTPAARPWRAAETTRIINLELPCSPCRGTAHGRRCPVPRCLDEIRPEQVVAQLRELRATDQRAAT